MYHIVELLAPESCKDTLNVIFENLPGVKDIGIPCDKSVHGTEYNLTHISQLNWIKSMVEETASVLYNKNLYTEDYWLSISEPNTTVVAHDHLDGEEINQFSCVLYLQADNNCGDLLLHHYNVRVNPMVGRLVCFDASCVHEVSLNMSSSSRICIAFDMKVL